MIGADGKKILPVYGDMRPVEVRKNNIRIAGWVEESKSGESVEFENAYNYEAEVLVSGKSEQVSDYYAKDGLSSQAGVPTPDSPIPITSNLPAGTYKYTSTDGIYEFTIDADLHGKETAVDKVVFDRVSHRGYLERRAGKKELDGTEAIARREDRDGENVAYFYSYGFDALIPITDNYTMLGFCNKFKIETLDNVWNPTTNYECLCLSGGINGRFRLRINKNRLSSLTAEAVKAYLAAQYATGTPVEVYYELAEPIVTYLDPATVPTYYPFTRIEQDGAVKGTIEATVKVME